MIQRLHAASLLTFVIALGASACTTQAGPKREISGAALYEKHCARCHGTDGNGNAAVPDAPLLTDLAKLGLNDDMRLKRAIQMGKAPRMPSFGNEFLEPSMRALIAHVRSLGQVPQPQPAAVKAPAETKAPKGNTPTDAKTPAAPVEADTPKSQ